MDYNDGALGLYDDIDDVEPSFGFTGEPMPSGWYPLRVEKLLEVQQRTTGTVQARLQLLTLEGEMKDKRAFVSLTLAPSKQNPDESQRTLEEVKKAAGNIRSQMAGFLKSLGVTTGHPAGSNDAEKASGFWNTREWETREFMGYVKLMPATEKWNASNRLNGYAPIEDEKKGLAQWRAKQTTAATGAKAETI